MVSGRGSGAVMAPLEKSLQIDLFLVRHAVLPAAKQNAKPFERQSANGGVVGFGRERYAW